MGTDLIGFESTSSLFESSRPNACIITANGEVLPLELTVCHELNFEKARYYREKRYRDLRKDLKINCTKFDTRRLMEQWLAKIRL